MPSPKVPCPRCGQPKSAKARLCGPCGKGKYERTPEVRARISAAQKGKPHESVKRLGDEPERTIVLKSGDDWDTLKEILEQQAALETDRNAYLRMLGLLTRQDMTGLTLVEPEPESNLAMEIKRPELALYDAQAVQLQAQKDQLNTSLWPRLNLNLQAGYGRPGLNMLSGSFDPYFVAGVRLQWDFGALYTLRNDRRKSDSDLRRLELTRESFMLNTSMEAVQKRSQVEKDEDVLRRDEEIISLRGSIRETGERQYKEGVIAVNDYLSLLDEEFKARLSYNVHKVTYIMDLLDLRQTLGVQ